MNNFISTLTDFISELVIPIIPLETIKTTINQLQNEILKEEIKKNISTLMKIFQPFSLIKDIFEPILPILGSDKKMFRLQMNLFDYANLQNNLVAVFQILFLIAGIIFCTKYIYKAICEILTFLFWIINKLASLFKHDRF